MKPLRTALIALTATFALSGCIFHQSAEVQSSLSYQDGYLDGCSTARQRSTTGDKGPVRDDTRYREDNLYHRGWNAGYRTCSAERNPQNPGNPGDVGHWHTHGPLD
jgi:hypothetical protein